MTATCDCGQPACEDGWDEERCCACHAAAKEAQPAPFVAVLDGRAVHPKGGSAYEFATQADAERALRTCYPGLAARTRALPAQVFAGYEQEATAVRFGAVAGPRRSGS